MRAADPLIPAEWRLCVFIPMFPALVAYESRAKRAEEIAKGAIDINLELQRNELADHGGAVEP